MYKTIDLFAGAGGLSSGFLQAGEFDIKVAFENSSYMQATYKKNHPGVEIQGDVCTADYSDLQKRFGPIDVVIGGPPCQGFSNANRQKNHAINQNNMLVKQYIRAILELQPKAFVLENVSMLKSEVHRFYITYADAEVVKRYSIPFKLTRLELLPSEFYFDEATEIVSNKEAIQQYLWPDDHYAALNVVFKTSKNIKKMQKTLMKYKNKLLKISSNYIPYEGRGHIAISNYKAFLSVKEYYEGTKSIADLAKDIEPALMYQRMLSKALEIYDNDILVESFADKNGLIANINSCAVFDYLQKILESDDNGYVISADVLCAADYGAPQKRMRFVVMGVKRSVSAKVALPKGIYDEDEYLTVRDAISDLEEIKPFVELDEDSGIPIIPHVASSELGRKLRDSAVLYNHIITNTTKTAMQRFRALKQGENFHALDEKLKANTYTDSSRTQNTIYLRLNYDEPSGTVVNVRKSMWIHPTKNRALSIREAARLQTFPDSFVFCGSKDKQYQQVGNAVPPIMAKAIAFKLASVLNRAKGRTENVMTDNHTKEVRSRNMSHIRSTNTKPEETVRKYLFSKGFRYRKNVRDLPGCPDIVLPKFRTVIFINGCFWHKHNCPRFVWPSTNREYWEPKILRNEERDQKNQETLAELGWRVIVIWECQLKKKNLEATMNAVISKIRSVAE